MVGTKVVARLLSPRGRPVTKGGVTTLEPSSNSEPAAAPGVLVLTTDTFGAKVAFVTSPGVETVVIAVGLSYNAVVEIELEMPSSSVATGDDTEVTITDPNSDSIVDDGISVPEDAMVEPVI